MKNSVETLIAHYEKLSKEDKDVFENEIEKKKNEYKNKYFSNIYKSRKKRVDSATAERKKELYKMESEIPVMLKKAYKEIEFLLNYATYEGRILRMWEYDGDCVFNRTDKEDFIDISTRIPANLFAEGIVPFFQKRNMYSSTKTSYLERSV